MIESGLRKPGGGKKYLQREIKQIEVDVFHTLNIKDIQKECCTRCYERNDHKR